ncbi:MAG TPA: peptide chain release factor N(5)-glutamine methyltransferase [Steroidobacteraceae bacterium]|nr:peptide chain release factor N(5)-glutamine methyltransferase [Steroidobacteraceae bacterium]
MSAVPTIGQSLRRANELLSAVSESPRLDAELLLGAALGLGRTALIARSEEPVGPGEAQRYGTLLAERVAGVPVAYLLGRREFWSLELEVSSAVLVPRPETETLVEQALALLPAAAPCAVLDLGTGSGAIAIALAHERPQARLVAVELSEAALAVARRNAARLVPGRIDVQAGSWYEPLAGERFDVIVSNPPYIAEGDRALAALAAEPPLALVSGPSGLEALTAVIAGARDHLIAGGALLLEHGADQGPAVARLLETHGFASIQTYTDGARRPRVTAARNPSEPGRVTRAEDFGHTDPLRLSPGTSS